MNDDKFRLWMQDVDDRVYDRLGVSVMDLPDQEWRAWFDEGLSPEEAIEEMEID